VYEYVNELQVFNSLAYANYAYIAIYHDSVSEVRNPWT